MAKLTHNQKQEPRRIAEDVKSLMAGLIQTLDYNQPVDLPGVCELLAGHLAQLKAEAVKHGP